MAAKTPAPAAGFKPLTYAATLGLFSYAAAAVFTPMCLLVMADELGFGLAEGGFIETVRGTLIVASLVLSGFVAGRWGKPTVLGVSALLMGAGLVAYAVAPTYAVVLLAIALVGVGSGVIEGLANPLVQDLHPEASGRYLNLTNAGWSVGILLTVLVVGELLTRGVSWRPIAATLGLLAMATGLFFLLAGGRPTHHRVTLRGVLGHWWGHAKLPRFWVFVLAMVLAGGVEGAYTFWSASYVQLQANATARAGGIGAACFAGGMLIGRLVFGWLVPQHRLRELILGSALAGCGVSLFVPLVDSVTQMYGVLLAAGLTVACFWPSVESYAAERMPVDVTTLFIQLSIAGIPGFSLTPWVMGLIAERHGLAASFWVLPGLFALLAVTLMCEAMRPPRTTGHPPEPLPPVDPVR